MQKLLHRYFLKQLQFKALFLLTSLFFLTLTSLSIWLILTTSQPNGNLFDADGLPANDPTRIEDKEYKALIEPASVTSILLISEDPIFSHKTLQKIASITEACEALTDVRWVSSLANSTNPKTIQMDGDSVLDLNDYLSEIPTDPDRLEQLSREVRSNPLVWKKLVPDEHTALINLGVEPGGDEIEFITRLEALLEDYQQPEKLTITGLKAMNTSIKIVIEDYLARYMPLLAVAVVSLLFLFGGFRLIFIFVYLIGFSILWDKGFERLYGIPLNVLTAAVITCLFAILTSYPVHIEEELFNLTRDDDDHLKNKIALSLSKVFPPITIAAITTLIGFSSLSQIRLVSITEFGFDVFVGIASGWLILFLTFAPVLYFSFFIRSALFGKSKFNTILDGTYRARTWVDRQFQRPLGWLANICVKPTLVVFIFFLLILAFLPGVLKVQVGSNTNSYFPKNHHIRNTASHLRKTTGGDSGFHIVLAAPEGQILEPDLLRKIRKLQRLAEESPEVAYTHSVVDELQYLTKRYFEEDYSGNSEMIDQEFLPTSRPLLEQLLLIFGSGLSEEVVDDKTYPSTASIFIWLDGQSSLRIKEVRDHIRQSADQLFESDADIRVLLGGEYMLWLANEDYFLPGKIRSLGVAFFWISILAGLVFSLTGIAVRWNKRANISKFLAGIGIETVVIGIATTIPTIIVSWLLFGVLGYLGILMNIAITVNSVIALGIGVDFSIHFEHHWRQELEQGGSIKTAIRNSVQDEGRRLFKDALTNVACFGFLITAPVAPLRELGTMLSIIMLVCPPVTMMVLSAVFIWIIGPLMKFYTRTANTGNRI